MMPLPHAFDVLDALLRDMERWPDATKYLPMDSAVDSPTGTDAILALRAVLGEKHVMLTYNGDGSLRKYNADR